jgi:hypothetical protein
VVIDDFDLIGITIPPNKTNPVLAVDPDRMLPGAVRRERLQMVPGRHLQVVKGPRRVDQKQLAAGDPFETSPGPMTNSRGEQCLGALASVREDRRWYSLLR